MPAHEIHLNLENIYLGYGSEQPDVHDKLDMFAKAMQSNHRSLLHDFRAVMYWWEEEKNIIKCWSAWAHIVLDSISMLPEVGKSRCIAKFLQMVMDGELPSYDPEALPPKILPYFPDDGFNWQEENMIYVKEV